MVVRRVVMVGAFPPPVHGMAAVNAAVRDALRQAYGRPQLIDLAARNLDRSLKARLSRLPSVLRGLACLASTRRLSGRTLYMSVSGGYGQVYELMFVALARMRGMKLYLHHHSFAYLDVRSRITGALVKAAGTSAVHVTLSAGMGDRLRGEYGARRVVPISNAVFFLGSECRCVKPRRQLRTVGFISNISEQKGVFEFLDLIAAAQSAELGLHAKLAGPFQDARTESGVRARLSGLPTVEYVGPKYNNEKDAFFAAIDVLVFPTRYVNEAEPLTLHEAMTRAIPILAYGRGCIPEIVGPDCGLVIDPNQPFVPAALVQIEAWMADPAAFEVASTASAARFAKTYTESEVHWQTLLGELTGGAEARTKTDDSFAAGLRSQAKRKRTGI